MPARRPAPPAHWTPEVTVAAIVTDAQGRYLLVEEERPDGLKLNNPAGHLEPGESPLDGAARECLEETARPFEAQAWLGVYLARTAVDGATYLRLAFAGTVGEPVPGLGLDEGIVRTVWMTLDEVRASRDRHRSPLVWRCVADHAAGRRLPLEAIVVDPSLLTDDDGGEPPFA